MLLAHCCQLVFLFRFFFAVFLLAFIQTAFNNHTFQRRCSLKRSVFHITCFVAEDSFKQFLFGCRIRLALRSNLTYYNITGLDVRTDADDTVLVQIFGSIFAHVRNIGGQFLHTALGVAYFKQVLYHVNRGEHIFTNNTLAQDDSILVVVTLPRNVCHLQVLTECQFTVLRSETFRQNLTFLHLVAFANNRMKVDRGVLVGLLEFRQFIFFLCRLEGYKLFLFSTVITNTYRIGIHKGYFAFAFRLYLRTRVTNQLTLNTCSDNRCFRTQQGYTLTHHVRTHQSTVGIIMLQERNQGCRNRSNLRGRYVHRVNLLRLYNREISFITSLYLIHQELAVLVQRRITLRYRHILFVLSREVHDMLVIKVNHTVLRLTVRSLNETKIIDLSVYTERRDKTDIRTFRCLNRTETTIVCIVYVTHLESGTVTTQTAGT